MNLPGEPDEQKKKIRKISKHHFDTQKEKLICSQSLDEFPLCSAPNKHQIWLLCFQMFTPQEKIIYYLANANEDSKYFIKSHCMGQTIF